MQVGDKISGTQGNYKHIAFRLEASLGTPGLFGQAFLCRRIDTDEEAVVKTLRSDRPSEDRERFLQEAQTLERIAAVEEGAGVHYAVRLLAASAPDAPEPFLIMERATGQNVLDDLLEDVIDWQSAPLDEYLALTIARHFARALGYVHQAGICYDDMKLDNLFWRSDQPDDPLRIIDWNVTSEVQTRGGVAGDWARFGARLYQLRTGVRVGVDRDGRVIGGGPDGPLWQRLPEGTRDLIEQALGLRYTDDARLMRDLEREIDEAQLQREGQWQQLLERALIADGTATSHTTIDVLAPLARAEQLLHALPADDPQRETRLAQCAELRQRAEARRGIASAKTLDYGRQSLERNEARRAVELFQKAYNDVGKRDPRPRRWLWLAYIAAERPETYGEVRDDLEHAVDILNMDDPERLGEARRRLATAVSPEMPRVKALLIEVEALLAAHKQQLDESLRQLGSLKELFDQYPDLRLLHERLQQQQQRLEREQAVLSEEKRQSGIFVEHKQQADQARECGDDQAAIAAYRRALEALTLLLRGERSPTFDPGQARKDRADVAVQIAQLEQQAEAQRLGSRALELSQRSDLQDRLQADMLLEQARQQWPALLSPSPATRPTGLRDLITRIEAIHPSLREARLLAEYLTEMQTTPLGHTQQEVGILFDRLRKEGITGSNGTSLADLKRELENSRGASIEDLHTNLEEARKDLDQGNLDGAREQLQAVRAHLPIHNDHQDIQSIRRMLEEYEKQLDEKTTRQTQQAERNRKIEDAQRLWQQAQDQVHAVLQEEPEHPQARSLQQIWDFHDLDERIQKKLADELNRHMDPLAQRVSSTLADNLATFPQKTELKTLEQNLRTGVVQDVTRQVAELSQMRHIETLAQRVPETLMNDLAKIKLLIEELSKTSRSPTTVQPTDSLAQNVPAATVESPPAIPQNPPDVLTQVSQTSPAQAEGTAPANRREEKPPELAQAAYDLAEMILREIPDTLRKSQDQTQYQRKVNKKLKPQEFKQLPQKRDLVKEILSLVQPHIPKAADSLNRLEASRERYSKRDSSQNGTTKTEELASSSSATEPDAMSANDEADKKKVKRKRIIAMAPGAVAIVALIAVVMGRIFFGTGQTREDLAGQGGGTKLLTIATALSETIMPATSTVSPTPSVTATPTSTARPVPFTAESIESFSPTDDDVFAHTLAQSTFTLKSDTILSNEDVARLTLRPDTSPPPDATTSDDDNGISTGEPIRLVRATRNDGGSEGNEEVVLQPENPLPELPLSVDEPELVLTLYVDDQPTGVTVTVRLEQKEVRGVLEENQDPADGNFFNLQDDGQDQRLTIFLWETPNQQENSQVKVESRDVVVVNDDTVYILEEQGEHYRIAVIKATDPDSQGQSGWIKRQYVDGGAALPARDR